MFIMCINTAYKAVLLMPAGVPGVEGAEGFDTLLKNTKHIATRDLPLDVRGVISTFNLQEQVARSRKFFK